MSRAKDPARRGFTMVEAAVAGVVVSTMLAAAMAVSAGAAQAQYKMAERATAGALADSILAEIMSQAYEDPASPVFGRETGEAASPRTGYDDVDDYDGLVETTPAQRDGTTIPGLSGWERSVAVQFVQLAAPDTASGTQTGLKRITVTIRHNNATVLTRRTLRSSAR